MGRGDGCSYNIIGVGTQGFRYTCALSILKLGQMGAHTSNRFLAAIFYNYILCPETVS